MKLETQTVEFKQSWHDECLKWICGFANAQGGKLIVGVDDGGKPVGVANATFYRAGFIEAWGRGIGKICEGFAKAGLSVPVFESVGGGVRVTAMRSKNIVTNVLGVSVGALNGALPDDKSWPQSWPKSWPQSVENKILSLLFFDDMARKTIAAQMGTTATSNSLRLATEKLMRLGYVEYLIPDRPRSRLQKYRLTDAGRNYVLSQNEEDAV